MEHILENLLQNRVLYRKNLNLLITDKYDRIHEISKYSKEGKKIILSDMIFNPSIPIGFAIY